MACKCCINPEEHLKKHAPKLLAGVQKIYSTARKEIKKIEERNRRIKKYGHSASNKR